MLCPGFPPWVGSAQSVGRAVTHAGVRRARVTRPVGGVVLAHLLDNAVALEQRAHLGLAEPAVATRSPDAADTPGGGPTRDRLGVDAEQRGHLARCQQTI